MSLQDKGEFGSSATFISNFGSAACLIIVEEEAAMWISGTQSYSKDIFLLEFSIVPGTCYAGFDTL